MGKTDADGFVTSENCSNVSAGDGGLSFVDDALSADSDVNSSADSAEAFELEPSVREELGADFRRAAVGCSVDPEAAMADEEPNGRESQDDAGVDSDAPDEEPEPIPAVKVSIYEPPTEELVNDLMSSPSLSEFEKTHDYVGTSAAEYLTRLLEEKGLSRPEVVAAAKLNSTFGYQIFTGSRNASRDKLLQLAFAMGLNRLETDRLLRLAGHSSLYVKLRRDAIIMFCLDHGFSLDKTEDELFRFGEKTIM